MTLLPTNQHKPTMEDLHPIAPYATVQPSVQRRHPSARTTESKKSRTHHEKGAASLTHAPPTNPTFDWRVHPQQPQADLRSHARGCGTIMRAPRCRSSTLCAPPRKKPMLEPVHAQHKTQPNIHTHHETAAPSAARMNNISSTPFHAEWGRSRAWARGEGEVGGWSHQRL